MALETGMQLEDAITKEMAGLSATWYQDHPTSLTQLAGMLGSTRALATELGVVARTVQRWLKMERGEAGQKRSPERNKSAQGKENASRLNTLRRIHAEQQMIESMRKRGVQVDIAGVIQDPSGNLRDADKRLTLLPGPKLDAFLLQWNMGNTTGAEKAFNTALMDAWDNGTGRMSGFGWVDVTALSMSTL